MAGSSRKGNSSTWITNVAKSLGYLGFEELKLSVPGITETVESIGEVVGDFKTAWSETGDLKGYKKIAAMTKFDADSYIGKAKELKNNFLEDIKSGNLNNESRGGDDDYGFDDDFDFDFDDDDDFSFDDDDGDSDVVVPDINIHANIGKNNPMVKAVERETRTMTSIAADTAKRDIEIAEAQMKFNSALTSKISGDMTTINDNIGAMVDFNNNIMNKFTSSSMSYYESSLNVLGSILDELKKSRAVSQMTAREINKLHADDVFGYGGGLNIKNYLANIKSNIKREVNESMVGSMASMAGSVDMFDQIVKNPIGFVLSMAMSPPQAVKDIMERFDSVISTFGTALVTKFNDLGEKSNNGFIQLLGKVLGFSPVKNERLDLGRYEKGPVPFDGIVRKSIVEVIPGYLSKILAAVSGNEPIMYDYENGKFVNALAKKDEFFKDIRRRITWEYEDYDKVTDAIKEKYTDPTKRKEMLDKIDTAFVKLSSQKGVVDYRDSQDLISKLFNDKTDKNNPLVKNNTLDVNDLETVMGIFSTVLDKTAQTRMFAGSDKMRGGEVFTKELERLLNNPMATGIAGGLYDDLNRKVDSTGKASAPKDVDPRLEELKEYLRTTGRTVIPERFQDLQYSLDTEAEAILRQNKNKSKGFTLFKNEDKNPIARFMNRVFEKPMDFIKTITNKMEDRFHEIIFGKDEEEKEKDPLFKRIENSFKKMWDDIKTKVKEAFEEFKQSDFYKALTGKANQFMSFIFGVKSGDGMYKDGLLSDTANVFKDYGNNIKEYFTGEDGVFARAKASLSGFVNDTKDAINNVIYGDTPVEDREKITIKGVVDSGYNMIKDGFQTFADLIFGPKTLNDGSKNTEHVDVSYITNKIKENAPDAMANGIIGLGAGALLSASSTGLLGNLVLGPLGGAMVGVAGTFLARSQTFQDMMFGYDDPDGKRIEGFISDKTQQWFKDNKSTLITGGLLGGIGGGILGIGALPAFVLGGPISGALLGIGTAFAIKSDGFQKLMFGKDSDGNKVGDGVVDGTKKLVSESLSKSNMNKKDISKVVGLIGAGTIGGMGLFTLLGASPLLGAGLGIASGIAASSDTIKDKIFGAEDSTGRRSGGVFDNFIDKIGDKVITPLMITGAEASTYMANWFDKKIAGPIVHTADYAFEALKAVGKNFVESKVGKLITFPFRLITNTTKFVGNTVIKLFTKTTSFIGKSIVKGVGNLVSGANFLLRRGFEGIIGAANGITGIGTTINTLWNLGSRERDRRRERNDRIKARNDALSAYKERIESTSLSARFMQSSNGKDARRQKKEMERALGRKYGKGYKNLDPVEKGKIDVAEAQAANISDMKDTEQEQTNILRDIFNAIKNFFGGKRPSDDTPMSEFVPDTNVGADFSISPSGKPKRNKNNSTDEPSLFDAPNLQLPMSIGPGGPKEDKFDPEDITPETDRTAATVGSGVSDAITKTFLDDKGKFAPLLKLGSNLGGLIAPFVGKGILLLGGALLLYKFLKDPSGFINAIVDGFRVLLNPLFDWLKDEGYAPQLAETEALYNVNEISTGGQDLRNEAKAGSLDANAYTSAVFEHIDTDLNSQKQISERNWFEKLMHGNEKTSPYNSGAISKTRLKDMKTEAQDVLWLEKQGYIAPLSDDERAKLNKYASLSDSDLKVTAFDHIDSISASLGKPDTWVNMFEQTKYTDDIFGTRQDVKDHAAGITYDDAVEATDGISHRATGAANIKKNDVFYLHEGEGVLTASANHLFGGAETTAGLLNAYARNGSLNDDKSALSAILNTTGGSLKPNIDMDSMMTPMYGTQSDMSKIEEYAQKIRESSLDVDSNSYWKFNDEDAKTYGPMARAMFNIIRYTNYPSRLITNAIKDIGKDLDETNVEIKSEITTSGTSTSKASSTIGGKIKNTVSGVISKIGETISGLFSGLGFGGLGPVTDRKPTGAYGGGETPAATTGGAVSIGMTGNDYYKFPSASVPVSDFNPARQLSSDPKPRRHNGLDLLSMAPDKSIRSTTNGMVVGAGDGGSYGNVAIIQDEIGMYHLYAHMKNIPDVKTGQSVKAGDKIGTEGNTGQSFGAHLHYEVGTGFSAVGSPLTGTVHPAEYLVGYNSGSKQIMATPLESYVAGSFWDGTGTNATALSPSGVNVGAASGASSSKKSGDLLSMLYAPLIEYNSSLKAAFEGRSSGSDNVTYGSTLGEISVSDLSGSDTGQKIWNGLISAGYTPNGAAGIMGNLRAESGLNPINLQDTYEGPLGYNDASYTAAVDSGKYPANKFINDAAGYGLAQWTYWTRKKKMLEAAKAQGKSIGDLGFQLNLLVDELKNSYTSVDNIARNPKASINEVSDTMLVDFENPAVKNYSDRRKFSQEAYAAYGGIAPDDDLITNRFKRVNGRLTPSANNEIMSAEIVSMLAMMGEYLKQIVTNTGKTATEAKAINNKVPAKSEQSTVSSKPTPTDSGSNSAMYDIANSRHRSEKAKRNYNIAKAIAKGY